MSCSICLERLRDAPDEENDTISACACGHVFHTTCIAQWSRSCRGRNQPITCPTCKARQDRPAQRLFLDLKRAVGFESAAERDLTLDALEEENAAANARVEEATAAATVRVAEANAAATVRVEAAERAEARLETELSVERAATADVQESLRQALGDLRAVQQAAQLDRRAKDEMGARLSEAQRTIAEMRELETRNEYVRAVLEPPVDRREGAALPLMGLKLSYQHVRTHGDLDELVELQQRCIEQLRGTHAKLQRVANEGREANVVLRAELQGAEAAAQHTQAQLSHLQRLYAQRRADEDEEGSEREEGEREGHSRGLEGTSWEDWAEAPGLLPPPPPQQQPQEAPDPHSPRHEPPRSARLGAGTAATAAASSGWGTKRPRAGPSFRGVATKAAQAEEEAKKRKVAYGPLDGYGTARPRPKKFGLATAAAAKSSKFGLSAVGPVRRGPDGTGGTHKKRVFKQGGGAKKGGATKGLRGW